MQTAPLDPAPEADLPPRSAHPHALPVQETLRRLEQEFARVLDAASDTSPESALDAATGPVYVTRPFLPPLEEFEPLLRQIWQTRILTNGGPFHQELEARLGDHLGVPQVALAQCQPGQREFLLRGERGVVVGHVVLSPDRVGRSAGQA